jgi:drug/metabolite transporter (DMT)-like permease
LGILLALGAAVSFSVMNLAIRKGGQTYPGENGVLPTLVVNGAAFTIVFAASWLAGGLLELRLDAIAAFMSVGLTGAFLGRTFLFGGINRIGAVRASALKNATPIVTLLIAIGLLGERFMLLGAMGIVLILAGVSVVVRESLRSYQPRPAARLGQVEGATGSGGSAHADRRDSAAGVGLALLSAVAFGSSNALSKVGMQIVPDAIQGGSFAAWAALAAYLAAAALRRELRSAIRAMTARRPLFWLAGLAGTAGNLAFFTAVHFAPVGAVTVVGASEVVITTLLGGLLAQRLEQVTRRIAIPALMVFAGAALIALSR